MENEVYWFVLLAGATLAIGLVSALLPRGTARSLEYRNGVNRFVRSLILFVVLADVLVLRALRGHGGWLFNAVALAVVAIEFVIVVRWAQQRARTRQSSDRSTE